MSNRGLTNGLWLADALRYCLEDPVADPDLTLIILREIQARLGTLEGGVVSIAKAQNETNSRLGSVENRLGNVENGLGVLAARFSIVDDAMTGLGAQVVFLGRYIKNNHEKAIAELRIRVSKLELKVGT